MGILVVVTLVVFDLTCVHESGVLPETAIGPLGKVESMLSGLEIC